MHGEIEKSEVLNPNLQNRQLLIGIALVAPVLLGLLLRYYLLPDAPQANNDTSGNNALMMSGVTAGNVQNINTPAQPAIGNTISLPSESDISNLNDTQLPNGLLE